MNDSLDDMINKINGVKYGLSQLKSAVDFYSDSEGYSEGFESDMFDDDYLDDIIIFLEECKEKEEL